MRSDQPDRGEITALVHTHGTRLARLAHLLGANRPDVTAASAMAATLLRRTRRSDAHDELLAAARVIGSSVIPQVRDDARLQGWLDRAERESYDVDLGALVGSTQHRLSMQLVARRRGRLLAGPSAVAVAVLVVAGILWPGEAPERTRLQVEGSGILFPNDPYLNGGDPNAVVAPELPPKLRVARPVPVAGVVLRGRMTAVMATSLAEGPATLLAVACTTDDGARATCVLLAPAGVSLPDIETESVLALLPSPRGGKVLNDLLPTVLRGSMIGTLASQTLLLDVTRPDVAAAVVTYTDGSHVLADRHPLPGRSTPLFVARNKDVMPTSVAYLDQDGRRLGHRSLYTTR